MPGTASGNLIVTAGSDPRKDGKPLGRGLMEASVWPQFPNTNHKEESGDLITTQSKLTSSTKRQQRHLCTRRLLTRCVKVDTASLGGVPPKHTYPEISVRKESDAHTPAAFTEQAGRARFQTASAVRTAEDEDPFQSKESKEHSRRAKT